MYGKTYATFILVIDIFNKLLKIFSSRIILKNRKNNNNWNNRNNQSTSSAPRLAFQHAQIEPTKAQSPLLPQTPEDIAFEEEFRKWEEQFEQWKKENQNHPDKTQYKAYEKQFMDVREKLLSVKFFKLPKISFY